MSAIHLASAQPVCAPIGFQTASSASLKPSSSSHITLLRESDGSYTAHEVTDASPYRAIRTTANFQKQLAACPTSPVASAPFAAAVAFVRLNSGGYLFVSGDTNPFLGIIVSIFDSGLNLTSEAQYSVLGAPGKPVLADLNGDGNPDIIVPRPYNSNDNEIQFQVFLGNGGSSFQPPVTYRISSASYISSLAVADLNGDNKLDIAVLSKGGLSSDPGKVSVFFGNGDGTFQPEKVAIPGGRAVALAIGDLNADGKADLALTALDSNFEPIVMAALGLGDGTFAAPTQYSVGGTDSVAIADMDGDGIPDIVTSGITVLFGDGKGGFPRRRDYWQETTGSIILADLDGDGRPDIVIGNGDALVLSGAAVSVFFNRGSGVFSGAPVSVVPNLATPNSSIRNLAAADFNRDGIADLVVQEPLRFRIMTGKGDGSFTPGFEYGPTPSGIYVAALTTVDLNNDGKPDVVAAIDAVTTPNSSIQLEVFLGQGDGSFQSPLSVPSVHGQVALAAADFNGDGKQDLALLVSTYEGAASDQVLIYLGDGKGGFSAPTSYPVGPQALAFAVGDFNGDGKPDLAIADTGTYQMLNGNLTFLFGKGDGTFSSAAMLPLSIGPEMGPEAVAAADFNRDGKLDLAVIMPDKTVWVLLGRGDGTFQSPVTYPITGDSGVSTADLNGDSIPDLIVWGIGGSYPPGYLLGNGDGTFQPEIRFASDAGPVIAADINGDGKLDVAAVARPVGVAGFLNVSQPAPPLAVVSAASFLAGPLAPESLATAFADNLASTVSVRDAAGTTRAAPLLYVSPKQINFLVPAGTSTGAATVTAGARSAQVQITPVAPSVFTVNAAGLAAANVVHVAADGAQTIEQASQGGIVFGPPSEQLYLVLYGTGIRNASPGSVAVNIQGLNASVSYAGPQDNFVGLDQVNVLLPRALAGSGDVNVVLSAGSTTANTVHITIQ